MKILSIELEGVNRLNRLYGVESRAKIESGYRPKDFFFTYLTQPFPFALDRYAAI